MSLNESIVEVAALEWFGEQGYAVGHGPRRSWSLWQTTLTLPGLPKLIASIMPSIETLKAQKDASFRWAFPGDDSEGTSMSAFEPEQVNHCATGENRGFWACPRL